MSARLGQRLRDPVTWTSVSQLLKTTLATVLAWVLAAQALHLRQPYLAPWAALLTIHATVFGTLRRGLQQAGASVAGVLVAFAAGRLFGLGAASVAAVILVGLVVGAVPGLRAETTTTAATALIVLTNGYSDDGSILGARLLDTVIGIALGLLINLLVWPPLRDRSVAALIDTVARRVGTLLGDMAAGVAAGSRPGDVDGWIAGADELDSELDRAWSVLAQARESGRMNPRRATARRMHAAQGFDDILGRLGQALAEIRSMARTIGLTGVPFDEWDPGFLHRWHGLLEQASQAIGAADAETITALRAELAGYARELTAGDLRAGFWPVAGALIVNLRNILDSLDAVAEAQPVSVPEPTLHPARHQRPPGG